MILTLILMLTLLALSASFSSLETALFSLTPVERRRMKQAGGVAGWAVKALDRPRELLTTVLFGNELVNVAISILAGGLAYEIFEGYDLQLLFVVSISVTTLVILVLGEIVPKNIAIRNPELLSQLLIVPYRIFGFFVTPLRAVFSRVTDFFVGLAGADPQKGRRLIVEEEFRNLLALGDQEGGLAELERNLIRNALDFSNVAVREIMTPRKAITAVPVTLPLSEIFQALLGRRYSRIPVYENNLNEITGLIHVKELLTYRAASHESGKPSLRQLVKPIGLVRPEEKLDEVFGRFRAERIHMGVVRDERESVIGLVTMDDLLRRFFQ